MVATHVCLTGRIYIRSNRELLSSALLQCQRPRRRLYRNVKCQDSDHKAREETPAVLKSLDLLDTLLPAQSQAENDLAKIDTSGSGSSREVEASSNSISLQASGAARFLPSELAAGSSAPGFEELKGLAEKKLRKYLKQPKLANLGKNPDALPTVEPHLSYYILLLNILIYGAGLAAGWFDGSDVSEDYFLGLAKVNSEIEGGQYYRLVTANFLHDSFVHLAASCYALYTLAPEVEKVLGYRIFTAVYLLTGLAGSTACFVFTDAITVGASSGLFGLIGALIAYLWKNQHIQQSSEQLMSIAGIIIFNLILGSWEETSIDNLGHVVGLATGTYLGWGLAPSLAPKVELEGEAENPLGGAQLGAQAPIEPAAPKEPNQATPLVDVGNPLARWAGCISFSATLGLIVVGTIIQRTGSLPAPVWWIPSL